jgi:hypothetical protein
VLGTQFEYACYELACICLHLLFCHTAACFGHCVFACSDAHWHTQHSAFRRHMLTWWCAVPRDTNHSSITISLLASHAHRWCAVPRDTNITTPRHTTALLKVGSTILAQAAGVPTLPWSGSGVAISFAECNGDIPPELYAKVRAWVGKRLNTST